MFITNFNEWVFLKSIDLDFLVNVDKVMRIDANAALMLNKAGVLYGVGCNKSGCLGIGDVDVTEEPIEVEGLLQVNSVKTMVNSRSHVLLLSGTDTVYSWGRNMYGQLGNGTIEDSFSPLMIGCLKEISDVACNKSYSLALTNDGKVYEWGSVSLSTSTMPQCFPKLMEDFSSQVITKIACGYNFALAVDDKGILYGWGDNSQGQLGTPNLTHFSNPIKLEIVGKKKVSNIAASNRSFISLFTDHIGNIYTWSLLQPEDPHCIMQVLSRGLPEAVESYIDSDFMLKDLNLDPNNISIVDSLEKAFDDAGTSDFVIKVHGKPINVHKSILKIRCEYFKKLFEHEWKDNVQNMVDYDCFSYDVFRAFLKYLYINEIDLSGGSIIELLQLANMYHIDDLKKKCGQKIMKEINTENAANIYHASIIHHEKDLEEYSFVFIVKNMTNVVKSSEFSKLDYETVLKLILRAADASAFKF